MECRQHGLAYDLPLLEPAESFLLRTRQIGRSGAKLGEL
jgi:hypothetical protein